MEGGREQEREETGRTGEEGKSRKRREEVAGYEGDASDGGGKKRARVDREGNGEKEETSSSGSEYVGEDSGSNEDGTSSVSLETESEYSDAGEENEGGEGSNAGRRKRSDVGQKLEELWRALEEGNLMDSSGSDYEGGEDSGAGDSEGVSLVEESDIGESGAEAWGAADQQGGSAGDGRSSIGTGGTRKKAVRCEERRKRRKARGDGAVDWGIPLTGEKGRAVTVKGRCTLDRLVSLNLRLTEYQQEAVRGTVLAPVLKYCTFSMERNLALALAKAWVPRRRAFRVGERVVPFSYLMLR